MICFDLMQAERCFIFEGCIFAFYRYTCIIFYDLYKRTLRHNVEGSIHAAEYVLWIQLVFGNWFNLYTHADQNIYLKVCKQCRSIRDDGLITAKSGNILQWRLIMKYFLLSVSG